MKKNIKNNINKIKALIRDHVNITPERAKTFFKTGKGHYAEGDVFIGITVPNLRKIAKTFSKLSLDDLQRLIESKINEERLLALFILVNQYQDIENQNKDELYQFYVRNLKHVNNWNLVDASAHLIIGAHLWDKNRSSLLTLAKSGGLWERRIAIVSTWYFIKNNDVEWTFKIAKILLQDKHDLIHKAVGWMLREAGKRNQTALITFLDQHAMHMPRTMLRYAIEKFSESVRKSYLHS